MRVVGLATSAVALSAGMAHADPPGMDYQIDWSGPFAGLHGGYLDGNVKGSQRFIGSWTDQANFDAGLVGGQIGFNFQQDLLVFGVELDQSFVLGDPVNLNLKDTTRVDLDWFGTARAKVGVATGPVFVYGTGGLALTTLEYSTNNFGNTVYDRDVEVGYVAGGGIAGQVHGGWRGYVEALYFNIDRDDDRLLRPSLEADGWMIRFGVNYHLMPQPGDN